MNGGITVNVWTITEWIIGTCLYGFRKVNNSFHLILKESKNVQLQYINVWFGLVHKSYKPAASIDFCLGLKYYDTRIFLPLKKVYITKYYNKLKQSRKDSMSKKRMSKLTENILSGYGSLFAIRMDAEMGITGDYTDQFVLVTVIQCLKMN